MEVGAFFLSRLCGGEVVAVLYGEREIFLSRLCGGEVAKTTLS